MKAMEAKGLRLDVLGEVPLAEIKAAAEAWDDTRPASLRTSSELRWQQRALRAEGKLAELGRMLDEYRDKGRPMPTYAELVRLLHG
jgi:hypothetical protein